MSSYDVSASSRAAVSELWNLLRDGSTWPRWSAIDSFELEQPPQSEDSGLQQRRPSELEGAIRVFRTGRNVSREQIVDLVPERRLTYVLLSGSSLLRSYQGEVDLDRLPDGGTSIRWRATWRAPVPVIGWLMQWYMRRFQQAMVDGLARYAQRNLVTPESGDADP